MRIFTIGYAGKTVAQFAGIIRDFGGTHVVDVRSSPYSKYHLDFNREQLVAVLPDHGLKYVYMGDSLGGKPADASVFDAGGRVIPDLAIARREFQTGLDQLQRALAQPDRTLALICACQKPEKCHRSRLIGEGLSARGFELMHVDEKGLVLTQSDVMKRLATLQKDLFDEIS